MHPWKAKIRVFFEGNGPFWCCETLGDDISFIEAGLLDSTGIIELANFLEEEFEIGVNDDDLIPENFDSINRIVSYLERKLGPSGNRFP
jgi:acyl carrier protein